MSALIVVHNYRNFSDVTCTAGAHRCQQRMLCAIDAANYLRAGHVRIQETRYNSKVFDLRGRRDLVRSSVWHFPVTVGWRSLIERVEGLRVGVNHSLVFCSDALDVGTAVRSRRIDLGYDNDNLQLWNRWVDVYLLWPPPPAAQITWVIPNYPRVPD